MNRSYVSPRLRARLTKALLIIGAVVTTVSMIMGALELVFPAFTEEGEIEDNVGGFVVALAQLGVGSLQILIYIATVILFLMWLYRSYENLPSFGTPPSNISYSSGWAMGSFFIPFVNLVVPYRAIKELWRNSSSTNAFLRDDSAPAWFPFWWAFWLMSNFASNLHFRMALREEMSREVLAVGGVIADALTIIAAILAVVVVEEITRRQEEASDSLRLAQISNHPPPPPTFEAAPMFPMATPDPRAD